MNESFLSKIKPRNLVCATTGSIEQQNRIRGRLANATEMYTDCFSWWKLESIWIHPIL